MANNTNENTNIYSLFQPVADAISSRPVPEIVKTSSSSNVSNRPTEYSDMANRRALIGLGRNEYEKALQAREHPIYTTLAGLASMPQQQGYGSFWGNAVRAFGSAGLAPYEARIDRLKQTYDLGNQEQQMAFEMDKSMGSSTDTTQDQTQTSVYTNMQTGAKKNGDEMSALGKKILSTNFGGVKLGKLNEEAGHWETNKFDPSDPSQGWWSRQNIAMQRGEDYGLRKSLGDERTKKFERFQTVAMDTAFEVLKALRPATDTDVKVALRKAGADPTMLAKARDEAVTAILNEQLVMAGYQPVKNLHEWDKFVEKISNQLYPNLDGQAAPIIPKHTNVDVANNTDDILTKYGAKRIQ